MQLVSRLPGQEKTRQDEEEKHEEDHEEEEEAMKYQILLACQTGSSVWLSVCVCVSPLFLLDGAGFSLRFFAF